MEIIERRTGEAVVLDLRGRLDFRVSGAFIGALEKVEEAGDQHLILNLKEVSYVDSAALGLLHFAHKKFRPARGKVTILHPQPHIRKVLELANIPSIIPICTAEEEALLVS